MENRSTLWRHRGPLAIHAARKWSPRGGRSDLVRRAAGYTYSEVPAWEPLQMISGVVLGAVDVVDVHEAAADCCASPWAERPRLVGGHLIQGQASAHMMLAHPRPLDRPVPVNGRLGLWDIPEELVRPWS